MRLRVGHVAALAAVAVLGVSAPGCGSKDSKSGTKTTATRFAPAVPVTNQELAEGVGACGLITQAEIQAAVGASADPGSGIRTAAGESCRWNLRSGANQFVSVILSAHGRQEFDQASKQLSAQSEQVPGVGDKAFAASTAVYVLKGDQLVILQVSNSQPVAARKQAAIKLVTGAMARVKA